MKTIKYLPVLFLYTALVGCGTQISPSGQERIDYLNSIKGYGEYWTKPGMTKESWRQDWVACGGMSNGQYSGNVPPGSTNAVSDALWEKEKRKLNACMKEKSYTYRYTGS